MTRLLPLAALLFPATAAAAPPAVTTVAYARTGDVVAFGTHGEVRVFDTADGKPGWVAKVDGRVTAVAYHPTGKWLAAAAGEPGKAGVVGLFRAAADGRTDLALGASAPGHKDAVYALAFSPDGRLLATAGYDRVIHLWNVPAGAAADLILLKPARTLTDHSDAVYAVAWHPDGTLLATGSADRSVKVWDPATGKRLYTLSEPTDWVYTLAWSPDGKHLACGGADKSVRVWAADRDGGKLVASAFAHEKPVWRLAYAPDGKTIYTAGEDRVVKAWDAAKLTETKTYPAQPDAVLDFALRPDGKQFAVARFDGAAVLLDPATGKETARPLPVKPPPAPPAPQEPKKAAPAVTRIGPNGAVRGQTTRVGIAGTGLDLATKVTADGPGVKAVLVRVAGFAVQHLDVTVGPTAAVGAVKLTFEGEGGKSAPVTFAIDRFQAVPETGSSDSARVAQTVRLPATLVGAVDRAGDADYFRFGAAAGDEIGVQATTTEIGSKLDPVLTLSDAAGNVLAEGSAVLGYRVPKAGTYSLGVRDREYRGGADFTYRLHAGPVPVVTGIFPLAGQRGRTTSVHLEGVNLGAATSAKVTIPATAAIGSKVPVPLPAGADKPLGKAELTVAEFPAVVADPVAGADLRVPGSADGVFTRPNESQSARFAAKKGERLVVEVLARRAGSPVDPAIEVLDASGKPVPRATLRCTAKTYTTLRDHDSEKPGIRLESAADFAFDDHLLIGGEVAKIVALPRNPDDDCQFYQFGGDRLGFLGTTPAHHALGAPVYKVEIHPPGRTFPPNGLPVVPVFYRNDDGGPGYGKDSFLLFDAPADGTYQVRVSDARGSAGPAHAYRVTVRPPKPDFSVSFSPKEPAVWKGGGVPVNVTVNRRDGFDGPVRVKLEGLPAGFSAPETSVEAGHFTTTFALSADADAAPAPLAELRLVGKADVGGKEVVRESAGAGLKLNGVGDIVTTVRAAEVAIVPGREARFVVDIARQGKFGGRVPVEVKGLPHGVRVHNNGLNGVLITERETSREVVLYAEPWVQPAEHPIVVYARREGTGTEHAAKSVLLKVGK
ncbi:MAG: hypothetical protein C0501_27330 [Isosphaera sp.]|nr:hypothetical protein [Isosphaera sp.]